MVYDDRPLYEINKAPSDEKVEPISSHPRYKFWEGNTHKSASTVSPVLAWHIHHEKLSREGKDNELDRNLIIAASKGVKNKWTDRYNKNPKKFEPVLTYQKIDNWNDILTD